MQIVLAWDDVPQWVQLGRENVEKPTVCFESASSDMLQALNLSGRKRRQLLPKNGEARLIETIPLVDKSEHKRHSLAGIVAATRSGKN